MIKSRCYKFGAIVTAVGIAVLPTAGLVNADPPGDMDTTTVPLPPPVDPTSPGSEQEPGVGTSTIEVVPPPESGGTTVVDTPPPVVDTATSTPVPQPPTQEVTELVPVTSTPSDEVATEAETTSPPVTQSSQEAEAIIPPVTGVETSGLPSNGSSPVEPSANSELGRTNSEIVPSGSSESVGSQPQQEEVTTPQPEQLQAVKEDVALAKTAVPVEQKPAPAPKQDIDNLLGLVASSSPNGDGRGHGGTTITTATTSPKSGGNHGGHDWDHKVKQWDRDWVRYDQYYRPIICNPYRDPIKVVYVYQGAPRVVVIAPLASVVVEVRDSGAYNFTAVHVNAFGATVNVAVGNFFGGGYHPGPGLPPPPPPQPIVYITNVILVVKYAKVAYQPIKVRRVVDCGYDRQYGARKVLLDGVTPVWGDWKQDSKTGGRVFEANRTQQFPGLDQPREGPLPGDYQLKTVSNSTNFSTGDVVAIAAVVGLAALIIGGFATGRINQRYRPHH